MDPEIIQKLKETHDCVGPTREGFAWVMAGDQSYHVDLNGKPAYPDRFAFVTDFYGGEAMGFTPENDMVCIRKKGDTLRLSPLA